MAQQKDLTQEKTVLIDADITCVDDSADSWKTKKVTFSSFFTSIMSKFTATLAEINRLCGGSTATAAEVNQICTGIERGGTATGDIVTIDGSQTLTNKIIYNPKFNSLDTTTTTSAQLNTLNNVTGFGRVNEVQQGLNVGNTTINSGTYCTYHGLINVNLSASGTISLGPVSGYNASETIVFRNLSATTIANVYTDGSDRFVEGSSDYGNVAISNGGTVVLMALGNGFWGIISYSKAVFA